MRRGACVLFLLWAATATAAEPRILYMLECQGCHLANGEGTPGKVPALAGSMGRFLAVDGGREFLVRVPGAAQSRLSDRDLAAVLNWMIERFGPEKAARDLVPFTPAEVGELRKRPLVEVEPERRRLLEQLSRE